MHWLSCDIILGVRILLTREEDEALLRFILVAECDLHVKLFFVQYLDLQIEEWLEEVELRTARILRQLKLRASISYVNVAFDRSVISFLDASLDQPRFDCRFVYEQKLGVLSKLDFREILTLNVEQADMVAILVLVLEHACLSILCT